MSKSKRFLSIALVLALIMSSLAFSASATLGDGNALSVDINLEVGTYSEGVWTPLPAGAALKANDVITVRINPESDFYCGVSRYIVMFSNTYFTIVNPGTSDRDAFTPNTETNDFYRLVCAGYYAALNIPQDGWPASLVASGDYSNNTAVAVNNQANFNSGNGGFPGLLPGGPEGWLFSFDLKVTQDIPVGAVARIWMDNAWLRNPGNPTGAMFFAKCESYEQLSATGDSVSYDFDVELDDINLAPPIPSTSTITFKLEDGTVVATLPGNIGDPVIPPANPTKQDYAFKGWNPALPATFPENDMTVTAEFIMLGDTTSDGMIDSGDALRALRASTGSVILPPDQIVAADVDNDEEITAADALMILRYSTGSLAHFPAQ